MTLIAGVDIGNASTEIVIADMSTTPPKPVLWDRFTTQGVKGSPRALIAGARMLKRLERRLGQDVDRAVITHQVPVQTRTLTVADHPAVLGRLKLLATGRSTPAGHGLGVGRPIEVGSSPDARIGPVILVARDPLGFRKTVASIDEWQRATGNVVGVLLAGDEAILVGNRVDVEIPILDLIDADAALSCDMIAVEVAGNGQLLREINDTIKIVANLHLPADEYRDAQLITRLLIGQANGAIGVVDRVAESTQDNFNQAIQHRDGQWFDLADADVRFQPPGSFQALSMAQGHVDPIHDIWLVDLYRILADLDLRSNILTKHQLLLATIEGSTAAIDQLQVFAVAWGGVVELCPSETHAARLGALTTPGAREHSHVIDIGAGTIDVIAAKGQATTAAGAGHLLTASVGTALGISVGAAEWVKRGPAVTVESPYLLLEENGTKRFLTDVAPAGSVGWLATTGPSGLFPFATGLTPTEWRSIRLRLKRKVLAENVRRALLDHAPSDLLLVGGATGDDELLPALAAELGDTVMGRGNVAGILGHRWSVAYGLILSL